MEILLKAWRSYSQSVEGVSNKLPSKDFITLARAFWKNKLHVKYQNPDAWIKYVAR
jgi:hypothetical protein